MFVLGDVPASSTLYLPFDTYDSNGGSVTITGFAVTDIEIYKNGSTTQRASDNGYTLLDTDGIDFDGTTGLHGFSVDLSDNSDAGFYAAGSQYWCNINAVTCDGQTIRFTYYFSIGLLLRPATAGRTLVVDAAGAADGNVVKWLGTAAFTPTTAGVPIVEPYAMNGWENYAVLIGGEVVDHPVMTSALGNAQSGTTTTFVDSNLTQADTDYWKGSLVLFTSGTLAGQHRLITAFTPATDTVTFAPATTQAVATHAYRIVPAGRVDLHSVAGTAQTAGDLAALINTVDDFLDTEVAAIKTKTDLLPSATAGSSGGLIINGSNSGTVTLAALTVSANVTVSGNFVASGASNNINLGTGAITAGVIAADAIGDSEIAADVYTAIWANATRTLTAATNVSSTGGTIPITAGGYVSADLKHWLAAAPNSLSGGLVQVDITNNAGNPTSAGNMRDFFTATGYNAPNSRIGAVTLVDTITSYTGNTPQTGDSFPQISGPGKSWYVATATASPAGNDSNSGRNPSVPKLTIAAAISAAASGDTIHLGPGTWTEGSLLISAKNLRIVGAGMFSTIIAPTSGTDYVLATLNSSLILEDIGLSSSTHGNTFQNSGTTLIGHTFRNVSVANTKTGGYGARIYGLCDQYLYTDCIFAAASGTAFFAEDGGNSHFLRCYFRGKDIAAYLTPLGNFSAVDCHFEVSGGDTTIALAIYGSTGVRSSSLISNCRIVSTAAAAGTAIGLEIGSQNVNAVHSICGGTVIKTPTPAGGIAYNFRGGGAARGQVYYTPDCQIDSTKFDTSGVNDLTIALALPNTNGSLIPLRTGYALSAAGLDLVAIEAAIAAGTGLVNDTGSQLTSLNARQVLALIASAVSYVLSGAGGTTIDIKPTGKPSAASRITATVDASGNRTAVNLRVPD